MLEAGTGVACASEGLDEVYLEAIKFLSKTSEKPSNRAFRYVLALS